MAFVDFAYIITNRCIPVRRPTGQLSALDLVLSHDEYILCWNGLVVYQYGVFDPRLPYPANKLVSWNGTYDQFDGDWYVRLDYRTLLRLRNVLTGVAPAA